MSNPLSIAKRTLSLALPAFHDEGALGGFKAWRRSLRLAWLAAFHAKAMGPWFDYLDRPENAGFLTAGGRIPLKPLRACIAAQWSVTRRAKVMRDTYELIKATGGPLAQMLRDRSGATLFTFDAAGPLEVAVGFNFPHYKEGEINVFLRRPGGAYIAVANLAFENRADGARTCTIGCVQGGKQNHEDTKQIEKAMHGLRPTSFIVFAAQEVAAALGATEVLGAGAKVQVHREKVLIHVPGMHKLSFDYDALWLDHDGVETPEGWFRLPRHLVRRTPEEMKPNKRSMYKKRYAMLDVLAAQIHAALRPATGAPTP